MTEPLSIYIMAGVYMFAGLFHFIKPKVYLRVMPKYLPNHKALVFLSGVAEILLGIGLTIPVLKDISIYGIIVMLILFLMVHVYMLSGEKASTGIPKWVLILRIPLQFGLMYWALVYLN